jgi:hypothetical protein
MAGLEAVLRITAKDEAGGALTQLKGQIAAIDKQIGTFDKLMAAAGKVAKATDPMIKSIAESTRALKEQRVAVNELASGLDSAEGAASAAAGGQERLRTAIMDTTREMAVQGVEAARVAEKIVKAQRRQVAAAREGGIGRKIGEAMPFLGPGILHETAKAAEAGATVQDEMARLRAAGATNEQIEQARSDFRDFSKTHSGVLESDYLGGFRDARVIAPSEQFEMARLGATYRAAARNSGLPTSETDVGNVMRIMDELGFKTMGQREDFLDNFLKSQQAFGSQISTETALSAYRNAKQSIYDWSPEFRDKYFPTLLQSSGQQGGTEMMTALSNYAGQHMQQSELRALASAGFVRNEDLITNKAGDVRGLKPGAKLFESDTFKSNIARWAWDFHDTYMKRQGATEGGFGTLIDRMPRNMAGLIAFLVHNRERLPRDAATIGLSVGQKAANDSWLAQNPGAGLGALRDSITQFAASVTAPAVAAAAPGLQALAHAIQTVSAAYGDFAKRNPEAAKAVGGAALAGGAATGGWLSWKLLTGLGKLFGFGGGTSGAAEGAAAAGGRGVLGRLLGGALVGGEEGSLGGPLGVVGGALVGAAATTLFDQQLKSWLAGGGGARPAGLGLGRDVHGPSTGPYAYFPAHAAASQSVSVSGSAQVNQEITVRIAPSPLLTAIVDQARQQSETTIPLIGGGTGRMDSDAGPTRRGGIGHQ